MAVRVLGIDPGLTRCGLGVVRIERARQLAFEHVEVLTTAASDDLQSRIHTLGLAIERLLDGAEPPDAIALERVFAQQNLPSVMGVAQVSGAALFLAAKRGIPVAMYTPNEVKMQVTGYGAADKAQVTAMVTRLLGLGAPPKPADAADALALAVTHAWQLSRAGGAGERAGRTATGRAGGGSAAHRLGSVAAGGAPAATPAQRVWQEAERKAGVRRKARRR